ncbi:MAG: hypothetical protein DWQ02_14650 [Bacteroidetes bacterium]|nr:MAG: hypothetical protein DWQ02_14650 [Bacteroidota bacterium]
MPKKEAKTLDGPMWLLPFWIGLDKAKVSVSGYVSNQNCCFFIVLEWLSWHYVIEKFVLEF